MKRPKLADTLEILANEGVNAFYNGSLTDKILKEIQNSGGIITKEDLLQYEVDFRQALNIDINNKYTGFTTDAPSSGPILAFIFNILQGIFIKLLERKSSI